MEHSQQQACGIVLEGGITSAVVYAGLLARLSRRYRFVDLGGASAGALAAAAAAIAERGRSRLQSMPGSDAQAPFNALDQLPEELASTDDKGRTTLFRLFQPQPATRRGYLVLAGLLDSLARERGTPAWLVLWRLLARHYPLAVAAGLLPSGWLLWLAWGAGGFTRLAGSASIALALLLLPLALLLPALWALLDSLRGMRGNLHGLCSGMPNPDHDAAPALTPRLHQIYNGLLGRDPDQPPVCFGDLWGAAGDGPPPPGRKRQIDLQVVTSALNLRRPLQLPGAPGADPLRGFLFDAQQWRLLFPQAVVDHLCTHGQPQPCVGADGEVLALHALPPPALWPVLMAVRMSLSFPALLSAVPLYRIVARRRRDGEADGEGGGDANPDAAPPERPQVERVLFSDGGLSSNCPIHLFDAPLPAFPTFGVNLYRLDERSPDNWRIELGDDIGAESREVTRFAEHPIWRLAFDFVCAILATAMDWRDTVQRELPGYRERIVHIGLRRGEGGLNLAMPGDVVRRLGRLGRAAAYRLQAEFALPQPGRANAWERHRWTRLRATLAATRRWLAQIDDRLRAESGDQPLAYRRLLQACPLPEQRYGDARGVEQAAALLDTVQAAAASFARSDEDAASPLDDNIARPSPALGLRPPL